MTENTQALYKVTTNNYPTVARLVLDVAETAAAVESALEGFLPPAPAGLYLPGQFKPTMVYGMPYYVYDVKEKKLLPSTINLDNVQTAAGDIYGADGLMVVSAAMIRRLSHVPYVAVYGTRIVKAAVEEMLGNFASRKLIKNYPRLEDVLVELVHSKVLERAGNVELDLHMAVKDRRGAVCATSEKIISTIFEPLVQAVDEILTDLRKQVREFLGDDDMILHFVKAKNGDIEVEKSIDYRIWDWERRMQSGEWA